MKRKTIILLSVAALAAAAGLFYFSRNNKPVSATLQTAKAHFGYIGKSVTATGTIQPVDTVVVGAQVSGVVKAVFADFNSTVKQGQILARVDPSIIRAQIDAAKATLGNAQSNLRYQQANYARQQQLYNLGAISKADYQLALNQYTVAKEVVNNASAQVKLAQRNLYYTNIYSPINGVVLNKNISAGQTIASSFSAPTLFVLARDLSKVLVKADVAEADIGEVRPTEHVTFTVDAFPDETFVGTVQKIYLHPSVSANVVTYPTLVDIDNRDMRLRPGMTASITIYTREDSNALLIPAKAFTFRPDSATLKKYVIQRAEMPGGRRLHENKTVADDFKSGKNMTAATNASYIWTKRGDTLTERKVWTGMNDGTVVQVVKGLSAGEVVVTAMSNGDKATGTASQRSPFVPQMRRPSGGGQGPRNQ